MRVLGRASKGSVGHSSGAELRKKENMQKEEEMKMSVGNGDRMGGESYT